MAQYLHLSEQLSVKLVAQVRCHFAFTDPQSSSPSEGVFKKKKKKRRLQSLCIVPREKLHSAEKSQLKNS